MQDRMEESLLRDRERISREELKRMAEREHELRAYRERIGLQERELEEYRSRLKEEQLAREIGFQKETEDRERFFAERERRIHEKEKLAERRINSVQEEVGLMRAKLEQEMAAKEAALQASMYELELEKARYNEESRKNIERKSGDYVAEALASLDSKEKSFHSLSKKWGVVGAGSLAMGLSFFIYITITSFSALPASPSWEFITLSVFKGLIAVGLFAALAKYSFLFSNSYMHEALKNGDRRHAINFGKFYLEAYGAAADWNQVKEAFEHWNIAASNAFSKPSESGLDVAALDKVVGCIEKIAGHIPKAAKD